MRQSNGIISITPTTEASDEPGDISAEVEWRKLVVSSELHGGRLDRALVQVAPEFSRNYLQQLIDARLVSVNGQAVSKASAKVRAGDALQIELRPTPQSQAFAPEPMSLDVVYEDQHLLVVNKPAGLVVHPAPGNWSGTLLNGLLAYDKGFAAVPRAGIVHRLDKDTTGLMVVARTRMVMDSLVESIAAREVSRQYVAIAHHAWNGAPKRLVDSPIGRDPKNRLRMAIVDLNIHAGKSAKTDFILLANGTRGCLVRCILHTGRTHQIRVHMASLGHPLVSDLVYGGKNVEAMARQALHATRLAFVHPVTREALVFNSGPPTDFVALLECWGLSYNEVS